MKYLYTTEPDEGCHEIEPGIWGRPVHTSEQPKLRKLGWEYNHERLRKGQDEKAKQHVRKQEEKEEALDDELATLRKTYERMYGKKPHHKMKAETIQQKIEQADG